MINHIELPNEVWSFIKPVDYTRILSVDEGHDFTTVDLSDFMTNEGIIWFAKRELVLRPKAFLFKISPNYEGPIHTDIVEYAINYVLGGHGVMQWISDLEATKYTVNHAGVTYERFNNIKKFSVSDTWSGTSSIVRINTPHRIVTTETDRYCLSIRTVSGASPKTFDDAVKLIYN